jgi:hypothetical protein
MSKFWPQRFVGCSSLHVNWYLVCFGRLAEKAGFPEWLAQAGQFESMRAVPAAA